MTDDQLTIEGLRRWSQILLWVSVILPVLGGIAAGARYYVERKEKQLSSRATQTSILSAKSEASTARKELDDYRNANAPRRLNEQQRALIISAGSNLPKLPIVVACRMLDGESCDFAADIADAVRAASLPVPDLAKVSLNDLPGYVAVHTPAQGSSVQAASLVEVLRGAGIDARREQVNENSVGSFRQGFFYIVVGRKAP